MFIIVHHFSFIQTLLGILGVVISTFVYIWSRIFITFVHFKCFIIYQLFIC